MKGSEGDAPQSSYRDVRQGCLAALVTARENTRRQVYISRVNTVYCRSLFPRPALGFNDAHSGTQSKTCDCTI